MLLANLLKIPVVTNSSVIDFNCNIYNIRYFDEIVIVIGYFSAIFFTDLAVRGYVKQTNAILKDFGL